MIRLFCSILLACLCAMPVTASADISVPVTQEAFSYAPVADPVLNDQAANAKPIGLGPVAEGGSVLKVHVALNRFTAPVDIYFGVYAPSINSEILVLQPDGLTFLPISSGLQPWKASVSQAVDEYLFGEISVSQLPAGDYTFMLLAAYPAGTWDSYYLWSTKIQLGAAAIEVCPLDKPLRGTLYVRVKYEVPPTIEVASEEVSMPFHVDCENLTEEGYPKVVGEGGGSVRITGHMGECTVTGTHEAQNLRGYYVAGDDQSGGYFYFLHDHNVSYTVYCPSYTLPVPGEWFLTDLTMPPVDGATAPIGVFQYRLELEE